MVVAPIVKVRKDSGDPALGQVAPRKPGKNKAGSGKRPLLSRIWRSKLLYLVLLPGIIHLLIFKFAPLGALVIAFQNYSPFLGISGSEWVGFDQFTKFLTDPLIPKLVKNTLILAALSLLVGFPIPIIFALLLNEVRNRHYKKAVQTSSFLPYFVSTAVVVSVMYTLFSPRGGLVNEIITALGGTEIFFFSEPGWFRPLYIMMSVWQGFGYSTIIYLAAISAIDPALYEAAEIDGASRLRRAWHITLPSITPMMVVLLIMNIGQILLVDLDRILLMYNPSVYETADVIQTYVYRLAFDPLGFPNYSYGAAVGLIQGVIALIMVVGANNIAKRTSESRLF